MNRDTWNRIKNSKHFYVNSYRSASTALLISCLLNVVLICSIYFVYFNQGDRDYYATNGMKPPIEIIAMSEPNYSSTPLLVDSEKQAVTTKVIPK